VVDTTVLDLVAAARCGDEAAFSELVRRYRHGICAVCLTRTGDFDLAEDLTQDAVLRARASLHTLRDDEAFGAWLRQIATNVCRMWMRRPEPDTTELAAATSLQVAQDTFHAARRRLAAREVREALAELPERNRIALVMYHLRGDTYAEIAEFLGVPESTVLGRIHRARNSLRRLLAERLADSIAGSGIDEGE
jgi:RNA polymerase sigma factor (sigma-70 family)